MLRPRAPCEPCVHFCLYFENGRARPGSADVLTHDRPPEAEHRKSHSQFRRRLFLAPIVAHAANDTTRPESPDDGVYPAWASC